MQRRLQDKVLFGSDYPGWSAGAVLRRMGDGGLQAGVIDKLFHQNAMRILKLETAVAAAGGGRK